MPIIFGNKLTDLAREKKIAEQFNFAKYPPPPVKEIREKKERGPRKQKTGLFGGFNPFAMAK